jgi:hypothetical protein
MPRQEDVAFKERKRQEAAALKEAQAKGSPPSYVMRTWWHKLMFYIPYGQPQRVGQPISENS